MAEPSLPVPLRDWSPLLQKRISCLLNDRIQPGFMFLVGARRSNEGWGEFEGATPSLYHTSLAVAALSRSDTTQYRHLCKDPILVYERKVRQAHQLPEKTNELISLYRTLGCDAHPDHLLLARVQDELLSRCGSSIEGVQSEPRTMLIAQAVLVIAEYRGPEHVPDWLISKLIRRQDSMSGFWPTEGAHPQGVVPSALATLALSRLPDDASQNSARRGYEWLVSMIDSPGWLDSTSDPYSGAIVVRALAGAPSSDYEIVAKGVDFLYDLRNPAGHWGSGRHGSSSVEKTALSLLALFDAGEHRFVTHRLAREALTDSEAYSKKLLEELAQRDASIEELVRKNCHDVTQKLEELQSQWRSKEEEVESLKSQLEQLKAQNSNRRVPLDSGRYDPRVARLRRFNSRPRRLLYYLSQAVLVVGAGTAILIDVSSTLGTWPTLLLGGLFALSVAILFIAMERRVAFLSPAVSANYSTIALLRRELTRLMKSWSPSLQQEFLDFYFRELLRVPPESFKRRFEEFFFRSGVPTDDFDLFVGLSGIASQLGEGDRRLLGEHLARNLSL